MEPGFITWIPDESKRGANITTLFLWNQCWPLSLASNIQVSECLGLGLRPPKASSKLRAPSTPAKPQHCRAVPATGRQHFSSQQGSSDVPGMQVAAERHEKPPGNVLIGFIACCLVHGMRYALSIFVVLSNQKESLTKAGSVLPEHWFREFFHF